MILDDLILVYGRFIWMTLFEACVFTLYEISIPKQNFP